MNQTSFLAASVISTQQIFLLLIVGLTGFFMIWSTQRKLRARANSPLDQPESAARRRGESEWRQDGDRLMVELQEFARQMNGQIDTRTAKLEALIRQADERIRTLRQVTVAGVASTVPAGTSSSERAGSGAGRAGAGRLSAGDGSSLHRRVVGLASEGLNAQQIASQLKITPSEVELVLALKRAAVRSSQAEPAETT